VETCEEEADALPCAVVPESHGRAKKLISTQTLYQLKQPMEPL